MAANAKAKEDQKWWTLNCLRGRLLAERQVSRLANQEAQSMGDKLIELENKLKEETRLRQKADKKLKFLMRKLQSLNINSPTLHDLQLLHYSDSSEISGFSSSASSSTDKDPQIEHKQYSSCSDDPSIKDSEDTNADSHSQSSNISMEMEKVDNSLALVAVSRKSSSELITVNKNVSEVLEALKNARENIQSSMERRKKTIR